MRVSQLVARGRGYNGCPRQAGWRGVVRCDPDAPAAPGARERHEKSDNTKLVLGDRA